MLVVLLDTLLNDIPDDWSVDGRRRGGNKPSMGVATHSWTSLLAKKMVIMYRFMTRVDPDVALTLTSRTPPGHPRRMDTRKGVYEGGERGEAHMEFGLSTRFTKGQKKKNPYV